MCNCNRKALEYSQNDHSRYREPFRLKDKQVVDYQGNVLTILEPIRDSYRDIVGYIALNESGQTIRLAQHLITKIL
jgi:hypothetical protein